ncbi:MAG: sulfatase [Planctomycetota bacterium]
MMRELAWFVFSLVLVSVSAAQVSSDDSVRQTDKDNQPNVVLFFIDDLGYSDLGCYGSTFYETPNIDRLAKSGVRFTDFYSANPVCSPTRAALMTGKAPQRVGITQWINQPNDIHLPLDEVTLGEAMGSGGYKTGYIGKWHLGEKDNQQPREQGFTWMRCVNRAGAPGSYFFPFKRQTKKAKSNAVRYWDVPDLKEGKKGDYLTDRMTDYAVDFIDQNRERPFFLCFAHYAVHTPIQAPDSVVQKYSEKLESNPDLKNRTSSERNEAVTRLVQCNPTYAAMVENLDINVGRVIDKLKQLGLSDNTVIVFTSDNGGLATLKKGRRNGGPTSCHPLRAGKGWTYEGGIRIPTFVCWPNHIQPNEVSTPGITMDLYPTILDLVGLPQRPNQHLDGSSLKPLLFGEPVSEPLRDRFLAWTYPHDHGSGHTPSNAIRMGDWKLVQLTDSETKDENRFELYNLREDIGETVNVVQSNPSRAEEMASVLKTWIQKTCLSGETPAQAK